MKLPLFAITLIALHLTAKGKNYIPCKDDPPKLKKRSEEIQLLLSSDQEMRQNFHQHSLSPKEIQLLLKKDRKHRKRIGEIFGEGCLITAKNLAAAALIFQHGDTPTQFFQTFLWAKQAVDLGDESSKNLMSLGIDRYLVSLGHKQLFATQAHKENGKDCWCLQEVEESFSDFERQKFAPSYKKSIEWVRTLNKDLLCPENPICPLKLKETPKGFVPGFW